MGGTPERDTQSRPQAALPGGTGSHSAAFSKRGYRDAGEWDPPCMKLTYSDFETGWEMIREGDSLHELRDGEVTHTYVTSPLRSVELHDIEVHQSSGQTYYVLTINDDYPNDVVECLSFRVTA